MSLALTIELTEQFIELAKEYQEEFREIKSSPYGHGTYQMKSRAVMKRKSMELSEALVKLRKHSAYAATP